MSYRGTKGPITISEEPEFIQGEGWAFNVVAVGGFNEISGLANQYINDGYEFSIDRGGPWTVLRAKRQSFDATDNQQVVDRYTFAKEQIEKEIWTLPGVQAEALTFGGGMSAYRALLEDTAETLDGAEETILNSSQFDPYPIMRKILIELTRGATAYEDEYITLRRERVVGIKYTPKLSLEANSIIYTTGELISVFGIPNFPYITMPATPTTPPNSRWGWRSRKQEVQFIEGQKIQVIQDWVYAAWSTNIYSTFS